MRTAYIDIPDDKWGVVVIFDYDISMEWYDLAAMMDAFFMDANDIDEALHVLSDYNTGMTVSRNDVRMSLVFVGDATSESQFWDTLSHEFLHVNTAIIDYYNEPYDKEGAAYLQGYLMRRAVEEITEPCK